MSYFEEIYGPGLDNYAPPRGGATTAPSRKADPAKEYVSAGAGYNLATQAKVLPDVVDDVSRDFGRRIYDAMDTDPACRSAKNALKLGIVAGGMDLAPAVKPKAGVKELTPDEQLAADLVDACWRSVERLDDFEATCFDLLEACRTGVKLAEATFELGTVGEDAGALVIKSLRVKPNDSWRFVVDDFNEVTGIEGRTPGTTEKAVYPPAKFVWLSWDPRDSDPRGTSIYRPAYDAWVNKQKTYPQRYKHMCQFGSASLVGKTAEGEVDRQPVDEAGNPIPGAPLVSPQQYMANTLVAFQNGSVVVVPAGAEVLPIQPQGDGAVFRNMLDDCNREITQAILLQTRATMEAQHGSKADSQTGQDVLGMLVEMGRKSLGACVRKMLRLLITLNHGEEVAARLTPLVTFGQTDQQDRAALWGAAATLKSSGYVGESQIAELDQMIGLPIRDAQADEAKAKAKAAEAMAQQQAMQPPPAMGAKPGDAAPTKPPGKPKPAEFAAEDYGTQQAGPWHDADIREARAILARNVPSAAALKRWERGEVDATSRLALLEYIADEAKATLTAEGQQLARDLAANPDAPAEFASPWELVSRFRDGVAATLRRYYVAGVLALSGPDAMDERAWEALRRQNQAQIAYLDGFAGDVMSGRQPRDGTLGARAGMYGQSVKVVAQAVEREKMITAGLTEERRIHVGDPTDMCPECRSEQAKGWQPIGTLKAIGACLCKTGCHCHFEYRGPGRS